MDPLKLLTRSTNLSSNTARNQRLAAKQAPSAGGAENPQIYDSEQGNALGQTSKKRKRYQKGQEQDEEISAELDFFAQPDGNGSASIHEPQSQNAEAPIHETSTVQGGYVQELSVQECNQVLKKHKIKAALLFECSPSKKSKKSKSKENTATITPITPYPLIDFSYLSSRYNISTRLHKNIQGQGYRTPTEVQMGTLPLLLSNEVPDAARKTSISQRKGRRHLLTVAPTGSGKTLAFLVPTLQGIMEQRRPQNAGAHPREGVAEKGIRALIIAPTKELAGQIVDEGRKLAVGTGIKVSLMRKGMIVIDQQESSFEAESDSGEDEDGTVGAKSSAGHSNASVIKPDILVSTPLLLQHAIQHADSDDVHPLPFVKNLILDEADVLLDPLFRSQTLSILEACTNRDLEVSLWSATVASSVEALVISTLSSRHSKVVGDSVTLSILRVVVGLKDSALPTISHGLTYTATEPGKLLALRQIIRPSSASKQKPEVRPPMLIFTQTIPRAIALHAELQYDIPPEAGGPSRIAVLHADLSDTVRSKIMARFRAAEIWILITTDLLARGVDFRGVNAVINYDIPNSAAAYVHRVGRTGRAGREGGVAVTLYTKEDIGHVKQVANVIAASEKARKRDARRADTDNIEHPPDNGLQKWLLNALPNPSKKDKRALKRHGVEARRPTSSGLEEQDDARARERRKMRISTKSGFERRLEHNRRQQRPKQEEALEENEWSGFDE